jgi:hypothetical protein
MWYHLKRLKVAERSRSQGGMEESLCIGCSFLLTAATMRYIIICTNLRWEMGEGSARGEGEVHGEYL